MEMKYEIIAKVKYRPDLKSHYLESEPGAFYEVLSKFENGDRIKITVEKYERRTQ